MPLSTIWTLQSIVSNIFTFLSHVHSFFISYTCCKNNVDDNCLAICIPNVSPFSNSHVFPLTHTPPLVWPWPCALLSLAPQRTLDLSIFFFLDFICSVMSCIYFSFFVPYLVVGFVLLDVLLILGLYLMVLYHFIYLFQKMNAYVKLVECLTLICSMTLVGTLNLILYNRIILYAIMLCFSLIYDKNL